MRLYISASWKQRDTVRAMASLYRRFGHQVYDFTDSRCRDADEIPPEKFPEQFDPTRHDYGRYLNRPEWRAAQDGNRAALAWCDAVVLLLPCGIDATADWAYAVGAGKRSIVVGQPVAGERSPVHLWADAITTSPLGVLLWLRQAWESDMQGWSFWEQCTATGMEPSSLRGISREEEVRRGLQGVQP